MNLKQSLDALVYYYHQLEVEGKLTEKEIILLPFLEDLTGALA